MKRYMFFPIFDRPKRNISRQQTKKISQPQPILGIFKNAGILNFLVEFAIVKIYFIMIPGTALFRRFTIRKTQANGHETITLASNFSSEMIFIFKNCLMSIDYVFCQ